MSEKKQKVRDEIIKILDGFLLLKYGLKNWNLAPDEALAEMQDFLEYIDG
jgi:hypothetical protein